MKTIPIKVFPKNTLIKYSSNYNNYFKIGIIKSCCILDTEVYYWVRFNDEFDDGQFVVELSSEQIDLFYPSRPMVTKMINVFEPGEFVFSKYNFNMLGFLQIGKIVHVEITGNVPTYSIKLLDNKTVELTSNIGLRLFHNQIMKTVDDREFLQLNKEVKRWKQDDDFIKYMNDKTILDTAGLMIRR